MFFDSFAPSPLQYLCELSLLEAEPYLQYPPSMISAAAIALARFNFDLPIWTEQLEELTGFSIHKLTDLILHLSQSHCAAVDSPQQAIQDKYKHSKYVSNLSIDHMAVEYDQVINRLNFLFILQIS